MTAPILAFDVGTTSTRALVIDQSGTILGQHQLQIALSTPKPGWVEQDALELVNLSIKCATEALASSSLTAHDIAAIGITNQRETTIAWDKRTGQPLYPAIVWQDTRTSSWCDDHRNSKTAKKISNIAGCPIDPYFSATKMAWLISEVNAVQQLANKQQLCFGTVDSYLLWHLTGGTIHATDVSNASRTLLMNQKTLAWDQECLDFFQIPIETLPSIKPTASDFGTTSTNVFATNIDIRGIVGDQQAALIGQGCLKPGMMKCTYGTGSFLLMHTGSKIIKSKNHLISSLAYQVNDEIAYCLEGGAFCAGSLLDWLQRETGLFNNTSEIEEMINPLTDNGGITFIPALSGLGPPHWQRDATAQIRGLTLASTRAHIIRAAIEGIAQQTREILQLMAAEAREKPDSLRVDGGVANNKWLRQYLADLCDIKVASPPHQEFVTAIGAAMVASVGAGLAPTLSAALANHGDDQISNPQQNDAWRQEQCDQWQNALNKCLLT